MTKNDPKHTFAVDVVRRLQDASYTALWAGGCVRDLLLGHDPADYDVATDARPDEVRRIFGRSRTFAVGASFGVILVRGAEAAGSVEVATFRSEGPYADGRRPTHVDFSSPEEDALRRDFTINGMFYDPLTLHLLDFVGGQDDLKKRLIRAIGNPRARMAEDKLRMLRGVRFAARFEFDLDPATADAIREQAADIRIVSAERIAQELRRMLVEQHRERAVELSRETGLLGEIVPELYRSEPKSDEPRDWQITRRMLAALEVPGFELAVAALLWNLPSVMNPLTPEVHELNDDARHGGLHIVHDVCRRLKLSNQETDHICWLVGHEDALTDAPKLPLSTLKRLLAHRWIDDLLKLHRVWAMANDASIETVTFCEEYLRSTPPEEIDPPPLLTGADLMEHGLQAGPRFRELLESVRDAQLNVEIRTKDEALALVDRLQQNSPKSAM